MRALLDVNVLIALIDEEHIHHARATDWLAAESASGWASCPLTENGCIRIVSEPRYPNTRPASEVVRVLQQGTRGADHAFWPDSVSLLAPRALAWDRVLSARQLTDCYLLALAVAHGGRLVTLDRGIPLAAVPRARAHHLVVLD